MAGLAPRIAAAPGNQSWRETDEPSSHDRGGGLHSSGNRRPGVLVRAAHEKARPVSGAGLAIRVVAQVVMTRAASGPASIIR